MRVHGVLLVRDGVTTVRATVLHHLSFGCERIHVCDNGSTDGTSEVLARLARRTPITVERDTGGFDQAERRAALARGAARAGADWVLVFDADEFWTARTSLREALERAGDAHALRVPITDFAQRREVERRSHRAPLTIEYRAAETVHPYDGEALVTAGEISFLEVGRVPRLLFRATEDVSVSAGVNTSSNTGPIADADGLEILHAGIQAREVLLQKAEHGERVDASGFVGNESWEHRRWAEIARRGDLDGEWPALSVDADGCVQLPSGERRRFVHDTRYRDIASRYIRSRPKQFAARLLARSY